MSANDDGEREGLAPSVPPNPPQKRLLTHHPVLQWVAVIALLAGLVGTSFTIKHYAFDADPATSTTNSPSVGTSAPAPGPSTGIAQGQLGPSPLPRPSPSVRPNTANNNPASTGRSAPTKAAAASPESAGTCLKSQGQSTPCTAPHALEVVADDGAACNARSLTAYLGGTPYVDVVRLAPTRRPLGTSANLTCVVAASGPFTAAPMRGALAGPDGSYLRRCLNVALSEQEVPCDVTHTKEFVGVPDGVAPTRGQCATAAAAYMNASLTRVSDDLSVDAIPTNTLDVEHPRCVIRVLAGEKLYDSVRALGTKALPTQAP